MLRFGISKLNHQSVRRLALDAYKNKVLSLAEASKPNVQKAIYELRPPLPQEIPDAIRQGIRLFKEANIKDLTVRDALLYGAVGFEVLCWFFVGEIIGKGSIVGYQV